MDWRCRTRSLIIAVIRWIVLPWLLLNYIGRRSRLCCRLLYFTTVAICWIRIRRLVGSELLLLLRFICCQSFDCCCLGCFDGFDCCWDCGGGVDVGSNTTLDEEDAFDSGFFLPRDCILASTSGRFCVNCFKDLLTTFVESREKVAWFMLVGLELPPEMKR